MHKLSCSSLALSEDGRYLLTAGDKVIKVWDYQMGFDINFQVLPVEGGKGVGFVLIKHFCIPGEESSKGPLWDPAQCPQSWFAQQLRNAALSPHCNNAVL